MENINTNLKNKFTLTVLSDTHGLHHKITNDLPGGDILLHAGDVMNAGYDERELISFCEWFDEIDNYKTKIFVAGNHCRLMENFPERAMEIINSYKSIIYLQDEEIIIDGIKIYGSPWQPFFCNWAFNLPRNGAGLLSRWEAIPEDTDILITHCPPFGYLDTVEGRRMENLGCELLRERVDKIAPQINVFGHIHSSRDYLFNGRTHLFNASILDEQYRYVYKPFTFEWDKENNEITFNNEATN